MTDIEQFQQSLIEAGKDYTRDEIIVIVVDGIEHQFNADGSKREVSMFDDAEKFVTEYEKWRDAVKIPVVIKHERALIGDKHE